MTGKQKLFYLLSRINDRRELTPSDESIKLHPNGDLEANFSDTELKEVLRKLENDDEVLIVTRPPIEGARLDYEDDRLRHLRGGNPLTPLVNFH